MKTDTHEIGKHMLGLGSKNQDKGMVSLFLRLKSAEMLAATILL